MIRLVRVLLSAAALAFSVGALASPDEKPAVKIEFRRAEREPAQGLQEATIEGTTAKIYLHKGPGVTNEDIAEARAVTEGGPRVELTLTGAGKEKMAKLTTGHQGKPLAVLVDGKVIAAPTVRDPITDNAMLSVRTNEEAERIAKGLQAK
jgi:preprotein translocase subunit SecD